MRLQYKGELIKNYCVERVIYTFGSCEGGDDDVFCIMTPLKLVGIYRRYGGKYCIWPSIFETVCFFWNVFLHGVTAQKTTLVNEKFLKLSFKVT